VHHESRQTALKKPRKKTMIEVLSNLFIGSQADEVGIRGQSGWFVVHACKEPYHRQVLGYSGRGASKDHPEYLIARRTGCLILNLVDVNDVNFIAPEIVDAALTDIHHNIKTSKILVHCNQGMSRSPTIAFLYLLKHSDIFSGLDHPASVQRFHGIYPPYAPAQGMADYVRANWAKYSSK
jgi:hypothetical protein